MFKIYDGRSQFYQWDLDRKLIVEDDSINEVHFCNRTDDCSLVCKVSSEKGLRVVNVPNVLLQDNWRINVYGYDKNYTKFSARFDVVSRSKPEDYVYTEEEIHHWTELEERIDQIEEKGVSDEKIESAVRDYLDENPVEVDLTGLATETYVDEAIAAIPEVDLSDYALKTDIPSTSGLATESYVDEKIKSIDIPDVDLTGYATEKFVKDEIKKAQISGGDVDLSDYYTKSEVDQMIEDIELIPGPAGEPGKDGAPGKDGKDYVLTEDDKAEIAGMVDVSGFQTADDVQAAITQALGEIGVAEEGAF